MTLKTSFFNPGIYKSTIKRYLWGSILYFIALFLLVPLSVLLSAETHYLHVPDNYFMDNPLILRSNYMAFPILLAIAVPTVVSVMIFRFIHSKNQTVFVHSLPVTRKANYISSILAAFTLMAVPVVLNGIILVFVSLFGYGDYFQPIHCILWTEYNLYTLFIMFSCAVFASNLTGNGFAAVGINILIHVFLFIIVAAFGTMAEKFIYGYTQMDTIFETIANNNFAYFTFGLSDKYFREKIEAWKYIEFSLASIVLYVSSYYLYKNRKLETSGDVAAFACLHSILKYSVTFLAASLCFVVFSSYIGENNIVFAIIVIIISLVAYVASEMLLKKTLNVFYSWKGYSVFAILFALMVAFVSQTTFFGFETRMPEKEEIKQATIYNYYYGPEEPFCENEKIIDMTLSLHSEFAKGQIPKISGRAYYGDEEPLTNLHIKYKLKNGKTLERKYIVPHDKCNKVMEELYEVEDYKKKCEIIFMEDSKITNVFVDHEYAIENYREFIEEVRKDVLSLGYNELYSYDSVGDETIYSIRLQYNTEEKETGEVVAVVNYNYITINKRYVNAIKWLDENGYSKYKRAPSTEVYVD